MQFGRAEGSVRRDYRNLKSDFVREWNRKVRLAVTDPADVEGEVAGTDETSGAISGGSGFAAP